MTVNVDEQVAKQDASIQAIYDALGQDLKGTVGATGTIFDQASQGTSSAYDQGLNDVKAITDRLSNRVGNAAAALGIDAATGGATQQLEETLAAGAGRLATQKATDLAALAGQGGAYKAIAERHVGDSQREGARVKVEASTKLKNALYDYLAREEKAKGDVEMSRLEQEAALRQLQMEIDGRRQEGELRLRAQQVANQQAAIDRAAASGGGPDDPLMPLKAEKMAMEIERMKKELEGGGVNAGKGILGVEQYLQSMGIDTDSPEAQAISNIASTAYRASAEGMMSGLNTRPYDLAMSYVYDDSMLNGADPATVMTAIQLMYGQTRYGE